MTFSVKKVSVFRAFSMIAVMWVVFGGFAAAVGAQENTGQTNSNSDPAATPAPTPAAIPLSNIVPEAESTNSTLKDITSRAQDVTAESSVERGLPSFIQSADAQIEKTNETVNSNPSLESLAALNTEWKALSRKLPDWKKDLDERAKALTADLARLSELDSAWKKTLSEIENSEAPPEIIRTINETIANISGARQTLENEQVRLVGLQTKLANQQERVAAAQADIKLSRDTLVDRLLIADSPPIWDAKVWVGARDDVARRAGDSFNEQFAALSDFANRNTAKFVGQGFLFLVLAGFLLYLRRFSVPKVEKEPELKNAAIIFYLPISTALLLAIFFNSWIYPQTPPLLRSIFGIIALIPTVIIIRRLSERQIYPILYSLVVFFLVDQIRNIVEPLTHFSRLLFLAEMLLGFLFFLWLWLGRLSENRTDEIVHERLYRTIKIGAIIAVPIFAVSMIANVLGYVSLARLVGNAVLSSAYAAVILYALVRIIDGLIIFALRFRPLNLLGMVKNNRMLIQFRIRRVLRWVAIILWVLIALQFLSLRQPIFESVGSFIFSEITIGSFSFSVGDIIAFILAVWGSVLVSRFIGFALNEDVFPRITTPRGVPYAVTTVLRYALVSLGVILALAIIGFDLTKFTILAGALGVGIGFGLQNIVNNFVSGIILLFERPVKVGDTIEFGVDKGDLTRIGMRASVVRTLQGSEIIVPNGDLISSKVTNWTLSDQLRRLEIDVGVAYGTNPHRVIELLTAMAAENDSVLDTPPPRTIFVGFGDSSLDFELRAWTADFDNWVVIKSDLTLGVHDVLKEAGIEIPFPQRDLHVVSVKESVAESFNKIEKTENPDDGSEQ